MAENLHLFAEIIAVNEATVAYAFYLNELGILRVAVIPASQAVPSLPEFYRTFNSGGYGAFANQFRGNNGEIQSYITGLAPETSYLLLMSPMNWSTGIWNDTLSVLPFSTTAVPQDGDAGGGQPSPAPPPAESAPADPPSQLPPPIDRVTWKVGPTVVAGSSTIDISFDTNIPSTVYVLILKADRNVKPSADQMKDGSLPDTFFHGDFPSSNGSTSLAGVVPPDVPCDVFIMAETAHGQKTQVTDFRDIKIPLVP